MRPKSIAEVATHVVDGKEFDLALANFLDGFYQKPGLEALSEKPVFNRAGGEVHVDLLNAYLAATAEHLAAENNFEPPEWCSNLGRSLRAPWFASDMSSLRALLIHESPPAFRSRNIFVSENVLSRR